LFWFDPPWHWVTATAADAIATAIGRREVVVTALRRDVMDESDEPALFQPVESEEDDTSEPRFLPRMLPYRCERYGLDVADFDHAAVIDVRLFATRDATGRQGYSPQQIQRWEAAPKDQPVAGGGWVPTAPFPPDVPEVVNLKNKLLQLRHLSPQASLFVSIHAHRLFDELPQVLGSEPDGVILRFDELAIDGLRLARLVQQARTLIEQCGSETLPLWIVPGEITPDDAAKLIHLGASAVAIDSWGQVALEEVQQWEQQISSGSTARLRRTDRQTVQRIASQSLQPKIDRFRGVNATLFGIAGPTSLATVDPTWARTLNLPQLFPEQG